MSLPDLKSGASASDESMPAPSESTSVGVQQCRLWLNWAAAQVDACLSSDNLASDQLLASLADLFGPRQPRAGAAPDPAAEALSCKMSAVVVAVQSHDRVMQGLAHVAESLRLLHEHLGDTSRADSAESWRMLREKQFRAFSMAEERALFTRLVARELEHGHEAAPNSGEAAELFLTDLGLFE
ncbi:MAG: hypothetical protein WA803_13300 [Steroidobacteraceae bacterium]